MKFKFELSTSCALKADRKSVYRCAQRPARDVHIPSGREAHWRCEQVGTPFQIERRSATVSANERVRQAASQSLFTRRGSIATNVGGWAT